MLDRLSLALERIQIFCANRLLLSIARSKPKQIEQSDDVLHALLPAWSQLIASRGAKHDAELRSSARSLLLGQLPAEDWSLIPSLEKREAPVKNTWTFQNEVMKWDIQDADLVLDIGSGGWPFKRANHLADKYPDDTTHRVEVMVRDQRPFFEVDLQRLPFDDQAYDFVFCSHVLEHLDNPGQAIRELMRVGRRGYIEVPTRLSDVMFNFTRLPNHHRWHGMVLGNTLVLTEWNEWERRDLGNHFFNALHSEYQNAFQDFFERNRDLFFASYRWKDAISFLIIDKHGKIIDSSLVDASDDQAAH
jgi:SAM-dependent methyltransferase